MKCAHSPLKVHKPKNNVTFRHFDLISSGKQVFAGMGHQKSPTNQRNDDQLRLNVSCGLSEVCVQFFTISNTHKTNHQRYLTPWEKWAIERTTCLVRLPIFTDHLRKLARDRASPSYCAMHSRNAANSIPCLKSQRVSNINLHCTY